MAGGLGSFDFGGTSTYAASFTVNSTGDQPDAVPGNGVCATAGAVCTLRAAMMESNALAGMDFISFSLGSGVPTIAPTSALPVLTGATIITGSAGGATRIEINGTGAGANVSGIVVGPTGDGSRLLDLVINRFDEFGVHVQAGANSVLLSGSYIGTDATGELDLGNGNIGVVIEGDTNFIGGAGSARNILSGNSGGLYVSGTGNSVQNNFIGTDKDGVSAIPNLVGIIVEGANNDIGGLGVGNVVSGNTGQGMIIGNPSTPLKNASALARSRGW